MKKLFSFIAILSLILTSCEGLDMGQSAKPEDLFSAADLAKLDGFDAEGGTARLTFTPNYDWEASANRAWITIDPESGVAGEEVKLKVSLAENTTDKEREGNVIVELNNGTTCKIKVRQLAGEPKEEPVVELVEGKTYDIDGNGGNLLVKVRTNTEYEVVIPTEAQEWLSVADTRAMREETLTFTATKNDTGVERSAKVTLTYNDGEEIRFTIYQDIAPQTPGGEEEKPAVELVNGETYNIEGNGGNLSVKVRTNTEYEVVIPTEAQEWLSVADTRAMREETLTFTATKNETGAERSAKVTLTYNDGEEIRFTIYQESAPQAPVSKTTIADVLAGENGNYSVEGAWVVATYDRGCLLTDDSGAYILAYNPATTPAVGTIVSISGSVTTYGGLKQFGAGAVVTETGSKSVTHPTPEVMDGVALDAYVSAPVVKFVSYEGTLAVSGNYYNVNLDGAATAIGSVQYPTADIKAQLGTLNGKKIKVTGYLIGVSSGKYTNTMAVAVEEVGGSGGDDPVVPPTPDTVSIAEILAGENGNYSVEEAWVVAIYDRGCLLTDNSGAYILAYNPATTPAVGTIVSISGSVTTYGGLKQFGAGAVVTETGSKSVTQPTPEVMDGAALDTYVSAPVVKFVSYEGTLAVSGNYYNINLDGAATAIGSIQYPTADIKAQLGTLNGKKIKVTGYLIGVSQSKYTNTMAVAVEEVGGSGGDDPVVPPTPEIPDSENIISLAANLTAGTYVMAGWSTSYTNNGQTFDWTDYPFHFWTGEVSALGSLTSNSDLKTVNGNAKFELDPNMSDQDKAKGYPASITLVAVDGKTDTYYVMVGTKYLYSSEFAKNRRMQLGDTPTEWVASDNANGGIQLTSNGVVLGTAGAQYNMIRSYANAGTLKCGLVFFKTTGSGTENFTPGGEQNPGWN